MRIETLTPQDAVAYRDLMLEAYEQAADAFTSTAEDRRAEPIGWWVKRIGAPAGMSQAFGAWDAQTLVGTVALEFSAKPKTRHAGLVIGMYVRPAWRGQAVGTLLMRAAIDSAAARPGTRVLNLTVTEGNGPAIRLYERMGFSTWGLEPQALLTSSGFKGKVHMAMFLSTSLPPAAAAATDPAQGGQAESSGQSGNSGGVAVRRRA